MRLSTGSSTHKETGKVLFSGTRPIIIAVLLGLAVLLPAGGAQATLISQQTPAPLLEWEDWVPVGGACGGVQYYAAISKDDGRNDFEIKVRIENQNNHTVQTRFNAVIESEEGVKKYRDKGGLGRLNAGRTAEACSSFPSLCLGAPFPSAVNQQTPTRIARLVLTSVDVANIDAPPPNAAPSAYLDPYRDYPHTRCENLSIAFGGSGVRFVRLTDTCVKGLPHWTKPDCDDAVDEIVKAFNRSTSQADQDCIKEWRAYQKCYEIYAFDASPDPKPSCQRPTCKLKW
jgi:hypothetical protein